MKRLDAESKLFFLEEKEQTLTDEQWQGQPFVEAGGALTINIWGVEPGWWGDDGLGKNRPCVQN